MTITLNLFYLSIAVVIILITYFIKECFFKTKDSDITNNILKKYPDVTSIFVSKSIREQNIENNQEIHDINKRFDKLERENKILKETLNKNIEIVEKLHKIIEDKNNGKMD